MPLEFDAHFGKIKPGESRAGKKPPADAGSDPDDEIKRPTDPDVVAALGFDPLEFESGD